MIDQLKVQGIWVDIFERESPYVDRDPIVVQYSIDEYNAKDESGYFAHMDRLKVWERSTD